MDMSKGSNPWKSDYGKRFEFSGISIPKLNKRLSTILLILVSIAVLSYVEYTRGNYIQVLEQNNTDLECDLDECLNETESLTSELDECGTLLDSSESSLRICKDEKKKLSSSAVKCENDLNYCEGDKDDWKNDYQNCISDLDHCEVLLDSQDEDLEDCEADFDNLQEDYDDLKDNYADDYCCLMQDSDPSITHYTISNNDISCGSSGTQLNC